MYIIWINKVTFEIRLDIQIYYIIQCLSTGIESKYLKSTLKNGQITLGIWKAITLGKKEQMYFLIKNS